MIREHQGERREKRYEIEEEGAGIRQDLGERREGTRREVVGMPSVCVVPVGVLEPPTAK